MTRFQYYTEAALPALLCLFATVMLLRAGGFLARIASAAAAMTERPAHERLMAAGRLLLGTFFPYYRNALKRPAYTALRYTFHAFLFIVPIFYSGHVVMWGVAGYGDYLILFPDAWMDAMSLAVIFLCAFFFVRRLFETPARETASPSDYLLILMAAAPFVTGYLHTHGTLNHVAVFRRYLWPLHILTGELMIAGTAFLFCVTRLRSEKCVGCAACESHCPTGPLETLDAGPHRFFRYSPTRCICCGACVAACPEGAAELRHRFGIAELFSLFGKGVIRKVERTRCQCCGEFFAPSPQLAKLDRITSENQIALKTLRQCDRCKKLGAGTSFRAMRNAGTGRQ